MEDDLDRAAKPSPEGVVVAERPEDVRLMLRDCRREAVAVSVLSGQFGAPLQGVFRAVRFETLVLTLVSVAGVRQVRPLEICCVTFHRGGRAFVFLSQLRHLDADSEPTRLVLALPHAIMGVEARSSFRVPVLAESRVRVRLIAEEVCRDWEVRVRDISLTGLRIHRLDGGGPELGEGAKIQVELQLGPQEVRVAAVVRRSDDKSLGLFFTQVLRAGNLEPPDSLRRIFSELETQWLRNHTR